MYLNCTSLEINHILFAKIKKDNDKYDKNIVAVLKTEYNKVLVKILENREELLYYNKQQIQFMTKKHIMKKYKLLY